MTVAVILYLLASIDSALLGYSAAAGRNALIRKRAYYRKAILRGWLLGQAAILTAGVAIASVLAASPERAILWNDFQGMGARMLWIYLPFAGLILAAFAFRAIPNVDVRCMTSTLIFGPLTFLRPIVGASGLAIGMAVAPRIEIIAGGTLVLGLMLSLEYVLGMLCVRRPL